MARLLPRLSSTRIFRPVLTVALGGAVLAAGSTLCLAGPSRASTAAHAQPVASVRLIDSRTATGQPAKKAPVRKIIRHTKKKKQAAPRTPRQIAKRLLAQRGWSGQFSCLDPLWARESGWRVSADNPYSGAYGIPQAEPGSQMASAGADWQTSAATQIRWGLSYIKDRYGDPCGAWSHEEAYGWY